MTQPDEAEADLGHDADHDHFHGETGGDLDDFAGIDQIEESFKVAADFWADPTNTRQVRNSLTDWSPSR